MPAIISAQHTTVILNGHTVTGLSEDGDAISLPEIELANTETGADGTLYASSTGMRGGEFVLKLLPTSASTKFFMNQHARILKGAIVEWNGKVENPSLGYSSRLRGGVMTKAPSGNTVGKGEAKNMEFTFMFEQIIPDYELAKFNALDRVEE